MDGYMGQVLLFAGSFVPGNWLTCDGQLLEISVYTALYSILGTTFGGDGSTTFALPDLRSVQPNGFLYIICVSGDYPPHP